MKPRRIWTYFAGGALILTTLALQGCFEESYVPANPVYGYGAPAYGYNPPVIYPGRPVYGTPLVYGDYDDHHQWHDRDWWMNNRRPWVEQHHREWLTARPAPHTAYEPHEGHTRD